MDKYKVGMRVEIVGHSNGFWNSYYGVNFLRVDRTKLRVRYEELIDDDEEEYIVEDVDLKHIRPYPPESFDINYRLAVGDDVDVETYGTFPYDDIRIHQEVKEVGKGFAWSQVKIAGSM
ncbi:hypothetical protein LXL04_008844 [Taraxacum kok-saghyz]